MSAHERHEVSAHEQHEVKNVCKSVRVGRVLKESDKIVSARGCLRGEECVGEC